MERRVVRTDRVLPLDTRELQKTGRSRSCVPIACQWPGLQGDDVDSARCLAYEQREYGDSGGDTASSETRKGERTFQGGLSEEQVAGGVRRKELTPATSGSPDAVASGLSLSGPQVPHVTGCTSRDLQVSQRLIVDVRGWHLFPYLVNIY